MRWRRALLREAIHLVLVVGWIALLHRTVSAYEVDGASMEPTLHTHQYVVVDTVGAESHSPQRGDVIVFHYPRDPRLEFVKRIVGLPGEKIAITRGRVWVNDQPLDEPYIREQPRYFWGPAQVPPNSLFVLGDNRNSSSDSHLWGPLPLNYVVGRAWFAYRPFAGWQWLAGQTPSFAAAP
jgi:signal peptidase I